MFVEPGAAGVRMIDRAGEFVRRLSRDFGPWKDFDGTKDFPTDSYVVFSRGQMACPHVAPGTSETTW